jgi:hypothetical protein
MISALSPQQAVASAARSLFVASSEHADTLTNELIAQALRRGVYILAPCASHELVRAVTQSFVGIGVEKEQLAERVDALLEDLIAYGDILEMRRALEDAWTASNAFLLRPAPPSFVARRNSSIAILGVAGDQITPLTGEVESRLVHRGVLRILPGEDKGLPNLLRGLGLLELPEKTWLRVPRVEGAAEHIAAWRALLAREPLSSAIEGLRILDTARPPTFYRDRWREPSRQHDGLFVARRPQRYGTELWCLVDLEKGTPRRCKDLAAAGDRVRPCDVAWRIQSALDFAVGKPQQFRRGAGTSSNSILRFFSPLPSWAERYLSVGGTKQKAERSLFSYAVSDADVENECKFLRELLWMSEATE